MSAVVTGRTPEPRAVPAQTELAYRKRRSAEASFALVLLDVDELKLTNDTLGTTQVMQFYWPLSIV